MTVYVDRRNPKVSARQSLRLRLHTGYTAYRVAGFQIKHREQSVRPQPRWLPLFQWSSNRRGDGQRKRCCPRKLQPTGQNASHNRTL